MTDSVLPLKRLLQHATKIFVRDENLKKWLVHKLANQRKLMGIMNWSSLAEKRKRKTKKKKKEKEKEDIQLSSSLQHIFTPKDNPILTRTFEFHHFIPSELEHNVTEPWTGAQAESNLMKLRQFIPLEYTNLGLNVIVDGAPGAGLSTLMETYSGTTELKVDSNSPLLFAECQRDLYNIGLLIPIKLYKYSPRDKPTDPYIKFTSGLLVKVDLWVFVLDITRTLDSVHTVIQTRLRLVGDYFKQIKINPALMFVGSKLDDREIREFSFEDGQKLAEKYGAMYTEMSPAHGMFVVRGFNSALRVAIGRREQKLLFANVNLT